MTDKVENSQEQDSNVVDVNADDFQFVEDDHEEVSEEVETESDTDQTKEGSAEADGEELELFLGDESQEASSATEDEKNPELVKNLRKEIQARNKRIQELEAGHKPASTVDINEKLILPTLESANYDESQYQAALSTYFEKKAAQQKAKEAQEEQNKQFQVQHQEKIKTYNERKAQLKVKDYSAMEKIVIDEVPDSVQGAILHYATQPELVVLAAGRNEKIRKELAQAKDPVQLGILIGQIEAKAKLLPKSKTDKPQSTPQVKGKAGKLPNIDDASFRKMFPDAIIE